MKLKCILFWMCFVVTGFAQTHKVSKEVLPTSSQSAWADAEIGAIIHFDVVNFVPGYDFRKWGTHPPASVFNPSRLDTDQWVRAAKAAGATYAVLVAKHCSGFSLWPTEAHPYSVKNAPWKNGKGDIVKDFIASCKKYKVKPGIYASAAANGYCYVDNPGVVQPGSPYTQQQYNAIVTKQLTELWSNYGKLFEIWFDGGVLPVKDGGPDLAPLLKKLQPEAILFQGPADAKNLIRWVGNEDGLAPYPNWSRSDAGTSASGTVAIDNMHGDPDGRIWCPGEADFPLRKGWQGGWFWKADDQKLLTVDQLLYNYISSVGKNSNMLLGIVVDTSGLVPAEDVQVLEAFGNELKKRFSKPIAEIKGSGKSFELTTGASPVNVQYIVIKEDINHGERIRKYTVEQWKDGNWQQVADGISVGHKRIHALQGVKTTKLRLTITKSSQTPELKQFAAY